jgi:hypothetical protein
VGLVVSARRCTGAAALAGRVSTFGDASGAVPVVPLPVWIGAAAGIAGSSVFAGTDLATKGVGAGGAVGLSWLTDSEKRRSGALGRPASDEDAAERPVAGVAPVSPRGLNGSRWLMSVARSGVAAAGGGVPVGVAAAGAPRLPNGDSICFPSMMAEGSLKLMRLDSELAKLASGASMGGAEDRITCSASELPCSRSLVSRASRSTTVVRSTPPLAPSISIAPERAAFASSPRRSSAAALRSSALGASRLGVPEEVCVAEVAGAAAGSGTACTTAAWSAVR